VRCAPWAATASPSSSTADGLAAMCVQHEMDHLMGKVFVEYLSPLKRDRIKTKMLKRQRDEQDA
jgi:peptide deformylase